MDADRIPPLTAALGEVAAQSAPFPPAWAVPTPSPTAAAWTQGWPGSASWDRRRNWPRYRPASTTRWSVRVSIRPGSRSCRTSPWAVSPRTTRTNTAPWPNSGTAYPAAGPARCPTPRLRCTPANATRRAGSPT
ncbi:MAG: hypothetical protein OXE87_11885 [Chloroflexi bacterium]|nr:hypothetical protein [Chloroflexota bacterium]